MLGNWGRYLADIEEDGDASDAAAVGSNQVRSHNRANEIEDPSAQYDAANQNAAGTITSRYYRFAYDDAGNMADERSGTALPIPPKVMAGQVMVYDAWNRLIATEHQPSTGSAVGISEHSYNALGWRVSKRMDSSKGAYDGVDQERVFLYDASWRMIEEPVDTNLDDTTDSVSQQFWGVRYIDDAVGRRVDRDGVGGGGWTTSPTDNFYYLTDVMFGVRALTDLSGVLHTRLDYTPYGVAMHGFAADADGDGVLSFADITASLTNSNGGTPLQPGDTGYDPDADLTGDGADSAAFLARYNAYAPGGSNPTFNAGWIDNPSDPNGPDNSVGFDGYWFDLAGATEMGSTGLYTVRHRVYDPGLGRWVRRDPAGYVDGLNLYLFTRSNPLKYSDFNGLTSAGVVIDYDPIDGPVLCPQGDPLQTPNATACDGYADLANAKCINSGGQSVSDSYPEDAHQVCRAFLQQYDFSDTVACVAKCLANAEGSCRYFTSCHRRNQCRLAVHSACYAKCKFIPYKGIPPGAAKVGWEDLLPSLVPDVTPLLPTVIDIITQPVQPYF